MDVFVDDWRTLGEDVGGKVDTHLKEYQSFTDLNYSKDKTISHINWHPSINGIVAVAMVERASLEERIDNSTKLLLKHPLVLFWSFSDPIKPRERAQRERLLLECPDDVLAFEFCPSDPNIIVGGCMNGLVVLWDISAHVDRLQGTRPSGGRSTSVSTETFVSGLYTYSDAIWILDLTVYKSVYFSNTNTAANAKEEMLMRLIAEQDNQEDDTRCEPPTRKPRREDQASSSLDCIFDEIANEQASVALTPGADLEEKRKNDVPVVHYCAISAIESGHKAPITDVQWLPETFEIEEWAKCGRCRTKFVPGAKFVPGT
ncbi:unnamed protein product [Boreogadus saida]